MYIKPVAGLSIRDPDRHDRLPPEGREVPDIPYWRRRLGEASVAVAEPSAEPAEGPSPPPASMSEKTGDAPQAPAAASARPRSKE